MSNVSILIPPPLRRFVGGDSRIAASADTVREAVDVFTARSEALRNHLFDENDALRRYVRVFVDGRAAVLSRGSDEPVRDGAEVSILIALAGG